MGYSPWGHKEPDLSTKQQHEMDNQQRPTVQNRESVQCYAEAWMGGEFGGAWLNAYTWLSPFAVHLKLLQHC